MHRPLKSLQTTLSSHFRINPFNAKFFKKKKKKTLNKGEAFAIVAIVAIVLSQLLLQRVYCLETIGWTTLGF